MSGFSANYDDTTKGTSDFFSKPFPSKNSVKISTETRLDGVLLKTATSRTVARVDNVDKEIFETVVEPKYEFPDLCTVELKLQTSNALSATLSRSNVFTKGFKLSLNGTQEFPTSDVQQTINATAEYQHEKFFFKATGGVPLEEGRPFPVGGNFVVRPLDNVYVGTKFNFTFTRGENAQVQKEVEFKIAGSSGKTSGFVTGSLDRKVGVAVMHTLNADDVAGVNVRAEFPTNANGQSKFSVDVAGQHKLTSQSTVNGKVNVTPGQGEKATGIRFGFGLTQKLNCCHAIATFGADVNVSSLLGTAGHPGHSLGFELKLKD